MKLPLEVALRCLVSEDGRPADFVVGVEAASMSEHGVYSIVGVNGEAIMTEFSVTNLAVVWIHPSKF